MPTIKINSGDVKYAIENEYGEVIGEIRFNPNDTDIYRRADEVEAWFRGLKFGEDVSMEEYFQFSDEVKQKFDYMLNRNVSGEIFKVCNPLTVTADGEMFFVNVLAVIIDVIREEQRKSYGELEKKIDDAVNEITNE